MKKVYIRTALVLGIFIIFSCENKSTEKVEFTNPYEQVGIDHNTESKEIMASITSIPDNVDDVITMVASIIKENSTDIQLKSSSIEDISSQLPPFPNSINDFDIENWVDELPYSENFKLEVLKTVESFKTFTSIDELTQDIKVREENLASKFVDEELRLLYEHLAVARHTVLFWSSEEYGGLDGYAFAVERSISLRGNEITLKSAAQVDLTKVFAIDCIGGFMGGAVGYAGASCISVIMQL